MKDHLIRGVAATTHIDKTGDQLSKEQLEEIARRMAEDSQPQYMYWEHETTLPPIGVTYEFWVEKCADADEYQLMFESVLFGDEYTHTLQEQDLLNRAYQQDSVQVPPIDQLQIATSYASFPQEAIETLLQETELIAPSRFLPHTRKAEIPPPVVWIFLAFAGGFVARLGERTADKTVTSLKALTSSVAKLLNNRYDDREADTIFALPIPNSVTIVEAAIEDAEATNIETAIATLPIVYQEAIRLVDANHNDYFDQIKYLFNPRTETWEINYLVLKKSKQIVLGPRYYDPEHPLHARYQLFQEGKLDLVSGKYGVSIGGTLPE